MLPEMKVAYAKASPIFSSDGQALEAVYGNDPCSFPVLTYA